MIINREGDTVFGLLDRDGIVSIHGNFAICLYYNDLQKEQYARMKELQNNLRDTDYKATKYAEGLYTDEEYAPIKAERQNWRDEYNQIKSEFIAPAISEDEANEAIEKYYSKKER